jgi:hypothetical protein
MVVINKKEEVKVGDIFKTTKSGDCLVVKYTNRSNITVIFKDNINHEIITNARDLTRGNILNPYFVRYYGFGYLGYGEYKTIKDKKSTPAYTAWKFLLKRNFNEVDLATAPTYMDCTICKTWANFQVFSEWFYSHESYGLGYELDKDLLVSGNRHYSPETCTMLPQSVNKALKTTQVNSGVAGVRKRKNTKGYQVRVTENGKRNHVGEFNCIEEASAAYVKAKEAYIKTLAEKWKGKIEDKAYQALLNWKVYPDSI